MAKETINAILCFHNHHTYLDSCVESLEGQATTIIIVDDGSMKSVRTPFFRVLRRPKSHGPAASFNYGVSKSKADWYLYVDPHCIFQPGAVGQMRGVAADKYDFVLGTGPHISLQEADPWAPALKQLAHSNIALTFLIKKTLWDELGGVPESPFCHMDVLGDTLVERGIPIAQVKNVCRHDVRRGFKEVSESFFQAGYSYGVLAKEGYKQGQDRNLIKMVTSLDTNQITLLVKLLLTASQQLGAITGLGLVPKEQLLLEPIVFDWIAEKED